MKQYYHINAHDLYEDEISYELALGHLPVNASLPTRMRNLRQALREPESEKVQLIDGYSLEEDYTIVPQNLQGIVHRMENNQPRGCWSRPVHYHKRVRRYVAGDRRTLDNQELLLDLINRLAIKYFNVDIESINTGAIPKRSSLDKVYGQLKVFLENPMATSPSIDSADLSVLFQTPEFRSAFVQAMNSVKPTMARQDPRSNVVSSFTAMNTSTPIESATATRPTPLLQSTQPTTTVPEGARRQLDISKFVHIDEIQGYIKACVN